MPLITAFLNAWSARRVLNAKLAENNFLRADVIPQLVFPIRKARA